MAVLEVLFGALHYQKQPFLLCISKSLDHLMIKYFAKLDSLNHAFNFA